MTKDTLVAANLITRGLRDLEPILKEAVAHKQEVSRTDGKPLTGMVRLDLIDMDSYIRRLETLIQEYEKQLALL